LVVLAGVLVAWALSTAADRVQVVQVAQVVRAGDVIEAGDLTSAGVAYDEAVHGLVPVASLGALVGRVAAVDLQPGSLVQTGMWRTAPFIVDGEQSVGALLPSGRFPSGLQRGDAALAASVDGATGGTVFAVRVLDMRTGADGELEVTLAVPAAQAVTVAQLAALDQLLLVGQPPAADESAGAGG
jgi:hypothetical protein